ncbi:CoA pyrophosphatase [Beggiatoa leptomitoformis]|uniref:CoA pyrophosphatase n=1 Tax=Beggiatoa leptomitoformis TaxID=288004 RepID=A0A2N9YDQ3_9GAMM|nr:CoA pyrophosphatase [Beggiatoa leptomitoformis]ALG69093.1 CoA pyrophosphatase [Beggiatoa leptomitoformis]AUI68495.1 CoA pyrophosphatase [Beggiatoa leptomitoformis]
MRQLIQQALLTTTFPTNGDFTLNPHAPKVAELIPAAVLLPLVAYPDGYRVILTQRTAHLHHHAGQICFPGGRVDATDQTPIDTALRETMEEIGLPAQFIEIAGSLDPYETGTGFLITPIVGFVQTGFQLTVDSFEVADVFEVPLSFLLDQRNHQREMMNYKGQPRFYHVFYYQERMIWGATAGILINFYQRLQLAMTQESKHTSRNTHSPKGLLV